MPLRFSILALALGTAVLARGDDPKDLAGEPLPKGAKARLGDTRLYFRTSPGLTPVPPDYKTLATPDGRGQPLHFEMATGMPLKKPTDDKPRITVGGDLTYSADGKRYALATPLELVVRDSATGKPLRELKREHPPGVPFLSTPAASLSADGKVLAWGAQDKDNRGLVTVWDVDKNEALFTATTVHQFSPISALSADGKFLATRGYGQIPLAGPDGKRKEDETSRTVQVWDIAAKKEVLKAKLPPPVTTGIFRLADFAISPDGSLLAASYGHGTVEWWDVKTGEARRQLLGRATQGQRLAFSPDGKTLAATGYDGGVQRWATADGKALPTSQFPGGPAPLIAQGLRFIDNERVLAWGGVGVRFAAWEAPTGKLLTPLPPHTNVIRSIAFADGGKELITSGLDDRTIRWDAATGKPLGRVTVRPAGSLSTNPVLMLSSDGTLGMTFTIPPTLFDIKTGFEEFVLPQGPTNRQASLTTTNADLTRVVLTLNSFDNTPTTCAVWDLVERRKLGEVSLDPGVRNVTGVGVSPSGKHMVTAHPIQAKPGAEGGEWLRITGWDVKTGKKLAEVEDVFARGDPNLVVVSDAYVVVAAANGKLRAYDYEIGRGGDEFEPGRDKLNPDGKPKLGPAPSYSRRPIVLSADGKQFAAAWAELNPTRYGVRVYEWPSGKMLHEFVGHSGAVTALRFSPDGKTLASGSEDSTVLLWDLTAQPVAK